MYLHLTGDEKELGTLTLSFWLWKSVYWMITHVEVHLRSSAFGAKQRKYAFPILHSLIWIISPKEMMRIAIFKTLYKMEFSHIIVEFQHWKYWSVHTHSHLKRHNIFICNKIKQFAIFEIKLRHLYLSLSSLIWGQVMWQGWILVAILSWNLNEVRHKCHWM